MVGEIDCREGLLVALERGLYPSLEEGIQQTLGVFRAAIAHLIQKKKFRVLSPSLPLFPTRAHPPFQVFVHPVNPVLDVTRPIVTLFNRHYQQMVSEIPGPLPLSLSSLSPSATAGCHWLDFFDALLSSAESSSVLRAEWKLDGTHLSPAYVSLLENAFQDLTKA
jgi:hypothetical protein